MRPQRQLIRVLQLAKRLIHYRLGAPLPPWTTLAEECGVSTRTVRRDVAALTEAGWFGPQQAYDERQRQARLTTCQRCRTPYYMTHPRAVCSRCRAQQAEASHA